MKTFFITLAIVLFFVLVAALSPNLDDHHDEWAQAEALAIAQKTARIAARAERAAAQLCMKLKGPNSGHRWTADNELVCTDNRGGSSTPVAKIAP